MTAGRSFLFRTSLQGALVVLPVFLTLFLCYWVLTSMEDVLARFVPEILYFPGAGWLLMLLLVFIVGLMGHLFFFDRLFRFGHDVMNRLPLIKGIYSTVNEAFMFLTRRDEGLQKPVRVDLPGLGSLIGFVTSNEPVGLSGKVAVYLPMSYQIGGYTLLIDRELLQPINVGLEEAMRFVLTAGVGSGANGAPDAGSEKGLSD